MKYIIFLGLFLSLSGCLNSVKDTPPPSPPAIYKPPKENVYFIHLEKSSALLLSGQLKESSVGNSGNMMYPGATAGSFIAAIAIHGAINGAAKNKKLSTQKKEAELLVEPYRVFEKAISTKNLSNQLAEQPEFLIDAKTIKDNRWILTAAPEVVITHSQKEILLKNTITIHEAKIEGKKELKKGGDFQTEVFVLSHDSKDPSYWLENDGVHFQDAVQKLFNDSVSLATEQFSNSRQPLDLKTIRYHLNGKKHVERGHLLKESCSHWIYLTLRKAVKMVPKINSECKVNT